MFVRKINLFYAHEMTCQKWPVLLMCRDSISEGFFHTLVSQDTAHSRAPRNGGGDCSGLPSERATLAFARGDGRHLKAPGGRAVLRIECLRLFSLCALASVDANQRPSKRASNPVRCAQVNVSMSC
jgi:hypothetical protein